MIRLDERNLYSRVKDVFKASSSNYDAESREAKAFFAMAQDKFHFAITGKTAAEIILDRAHEGLLGCAKEAKTRRKMTKRPPTEGPTSAKCW